MSFRRIVLTKSLLTRYQNKKGFEARCHGQKCDVRLKLGDKCYSHRGGKNRSKTKYYCVSCYQRLWL